MHAGLMSAKILEMLTEPIVAPYGPFCMSAHTLSSVRKPSYTNYNGFRSTFSYKSATLRILSATQIVTNSSKLEGYPLRPAQFNLLAFLSDFSAVAHK